MHDPRSTESTEPDRPTGLEVIFSEDPPEITPDLAQALLKMLTNVHAARSGQPRSADRNEQRRSA